MGPSPGKASKNASATLKSSPDAKSSTVAAFPPTPTYTSPSSKHPTIVIRQKSPLLIATPPSVTRALTFSHPFLLPLNRLAGLLSWTSGDPWESFLLVAVFWALVLYSDIIVRWAGPVVCVVVLILGMYLRRFSPLSSSGWTAEGRNGNGKQQFESNMRHQKSLDEIVDTLALFTSRCNVLLEPLLELTDFLSTQTTATSATTRPALTSLLLRILLVTPIWIIMSFPPLSIITTQRVILTLGTLILSWHSRPARVSRTLLWRSQLVRYISSLVTGLPFSSGTSTLPLRTDVALQPPSSKKNQQDIASSLPVDGHANPSGVRFTFSVFENQRRWVGLGWTHSLLAYERAVWTDDHLNPSKSKENFRLPVVESGAAQWRWVPGSEWQVEGAGKSSSGDSEDGWIYYDNKVMAILKIATLKCSSSASGTMAVVDRMVGADTRGVGSGFGMQN